MSSAGFVLIDSLYRPVYADPESVKVLVFPNSASSPESLDGLLTQKILSFLPPDLEVSQGISVAQFQSGKRRYLCRAFVVESYWNGGEQKKGIALLLERGLPGPPAGARKQRMPAGLCEDPFGFSPDVKYYNFSRAHRETFAALRNMVRQGRGIGVLLGPAGIGKTILLNYLAEYLRRESEIAIFPGSFSSRAEFVRGIMATLGVDGLGRDLSTNLQQFKNWLLTKNLLGRRVTLICDDAQDFTFETFENLSLFSDLELGQQKLLQIVLAGRQGLLGKLTGHRLESISRKFNLFCRLGPLDEAEVRNYVMHRLRIGGCTRQLFGSAALSAIALYSRGIPLNINMICRHSLSLDNDINLQVIDERIIADSAYDLVLRSAPTSIPDEASGGLYFTDPPQRSGVLRDRRGLKLVPKS